MILGVEWITKLKEVVISWGKLTMSFKQGGKEITIRRDPTLAREVIAPEALLKITEVGIVTLIWGLRRMEVPGEKEEK